jgi:glycine cleavage system aminomethyltransferase T
MLPGVSLRDLSDAQVGWALVGPKSREVLAQLTEEDVSNEAFPFMSCRTMDVGVIPCSMLYASWMARRRSVSSEMAAAWSRIPSRSAFA